MKTLFTVLLSLCFAGAAISGVYQEEPYIFDMGDCLVTLPNSYERVGRLKTHNGEDRFAFENQGTFLQVFKTKTYHQVETEDDLELLENFDYSGLSRYYREVAGLDLKFFIIKGDLNVLVFSNLNKEMVSNESLKIAHSCSRIKIKSKQIIIGVR